jgi:PEGA domain-containing protein
MLKFWSTTAIVCFFVSSLGAEVAEKPMTLRQVEDLVEAKVDGARVAQAIRSRGVRFLASDSCLGYLRSLGAKEEVEQALRSAGQAPYSKEDLLAEIARHQGDQSLAESVRSRGINFHPTDDDLDTLKVAGADARLVESLRSARVPSAQDFEPCPPITGKVETPESPPEPGRKVEPALGPHETANPPAGQSETGGVVAPREGETEKTPAGSAEATAPAALVGGLDIVTDPPGLDVVIDGRSYGRSPIHTAMSEGEHTYRVKPLGMPAFEKRFTITSGTIRILHIYYVPLPVPPTGTLVVETNPPGATVEVDGGSFAGWTPATFELPAGPHQVRITMEGYRPIARAVRLEPDRTLSFRERLQRGETPARRSTAARAARPDSSGSRP